jgi:hypothetical protein
MALDAETAMKPRAAQLTDYFLKSGVSEFCLAGQQTGGNFT